MKLIILAGGSGTRFYPLTKTLPKGLIPIEGKPLLEHTLEPYLKSVSDIIIVINDELGHMIKEYFGDVYNNHNVLYVVQKSSDKKGTMSALNLCRDYIENNELFIVSNCDDVFMESELVGVIDKKEIGMGITKTTMPRAYHGIDVNDGYIVGLRRHTKEDPDLIEDSFANGFYVLDKKVFEFEPVPIMDGELGLPQTLFAHLSEYPLKAFNFSMWQCVNNPTDLENARKFLK